MLRFTKQKEQFKSYGVFVLSKRNNLNVTVYMY